MPNDTHRTAVAANHAVWEAWTPHHIGSGGYDIPGFIAGRETLCPISLAGVGDVTGKTLLHLQCHFGLDTLSWARRGATVTGVDFVASAVAKARELAAEVAPSAEFVCCDVYDAPACLKRQFDVVFTSVGVLGWLPDLERWAHVMASLVTPGGCLYLAEFHPFTHVFGDDDLSVEYAYFHEPDRPFEFPNTGDYANPGAETVHNRAFEWNHGLGSVVSAIIGAGFTLEFLHEHDSTLFKRWPFLVGERGTFRLPEGMPSLPLIYSLRAVPRR